MGRLQTAYYDIRLYQPLPFPEYEKETPTRLDCPARYDVIKANYGSFKGKTMYDLCSANCYFGFRFLQDGGEEVIAVEIDAKVCDFVNGLAKEKGLNLHCYKERIVERRFCKHDIGLYLDTHYHEGTDGFIEFLKGQCQVIFTSSKINSGEYMVHLMNLFAHVQPIYTGYQERTIYKCW